MVHFFSGRISRSIYKLIYKLFFPKVANTTVAIGHFIVLNATHRIVLRKFILRKNWFLIISFPHKFCIKCTLVATGPSIQQLNPEILHQSDQDYIGVNGAIAFDSIPFSSYVIIDHNFVNNH